MKKNRLSLAQLCLVCLLCLAMAPYAHAQDSTYSFTTVKEIEITPTKNQNSTGTCWAFSAIGLIEAELIRTGKGHYDLAEMFVANLSYKDKAEKFVRLHGKINFAQGGSFADALYVFKHYGALPKEVYSGLLNGEEKHAHSELEQAAKAYLDKIVSNPNGKLTASWQKAFHAIVDSYLGEIPNNFEYKGKSYTPQSFAKSLELNVDDYVSITSFTHHPFYTSFPIEIPDNWRWTDSYNVTIKELMETIDHAVNNGYTVAWASDVSEKGFTRDGLATAPDIKLLEDEAAGSDQAHWTGLSKKEREDEVKKLAAKPCKEVDVTQELRQEAFDNYQTTDDHGMLIYGIAYDQNGKKFYLVKNSWGTDNKRNGVWYASEAFVAYKTINVVLHKNALPNSVKEKWMKSTR